MKIPRYLLALAFLLAFPVDPSFGEKAGSSPSKPAPSSQAGAPRGKPASQGNAKADPRWKEIPAGTGIYDQEGVVSRCEVFSENGKCGLAIKGKKVIPAKWTYWDAQFKFESDGSGIFEFSDLTPAAIALVKKERGTSLKDLAFAEAVGMGLRREEHINAFVQKYLFDSGVQPYSKSDYKGIKLLEGKETYRVPPTDDPYALVAFREGDQAGLRIAGDPRAVVVPAGGLGSVQGIPVMKGSVGLLAATTGDQLKSNAGPLLPNLLSAFASRTSTVGYVLLPEAVILRILNKPDRAIFKKWRSHPDTGEMVIQFVEQHDRTYRAALVLDGKKVDEQKVDWQKIEEKEPPASWSVDDLDKDWKQVWEILRDRLPKP